MGNVSKYFAKNKRTPSATLRLREQTCKRARAFCRTPVRGLCEQNRNSCRRAKQYKTRFRRVQFRVFILTEMIYRRSWHRRMNITLRYGSAAVGLRRRLLTWYVAVRRRNKKNRNCVRRKRKLAYRQTSASCSARSLPTIFQRVLSKR